jgi:hypothetical protein
MDHWYWTVICKTPECGERHWLDYIGLFPSGFVVAPSPAAVSGLHCDRCDKVHDYQPLELELRSFPGKAPDTGRM